MKKALWFFCIPILAFLINAPVGITGDPIDIDHGSTYRELVTAVNLNPLGTFAGATDYYPSVIGWNANAWYDLSIWYSLFGGVTMTVEISPDLSVRMSEAGAIGDIEIAVRSLYGIEADQILQIGIQQQRNVVGINPANNKIILDAALTSAVINGTTIVIDPNWNDITRTGYDAINYQYNQPSYVSDNTGIVDIDNLNTMRIRIKIVTAALQQGDTNYVRLKVKYR